MRLQRITATAVSNTLLPLDSNQVMYNESCYLYGSSTVSATATVYGIISNLYANLPVSFSRSGTTVTLTFQSAHFAAASAIFVNVCNSGVTSIDGVYAVVTVGSTTTLTYTSGTSATTSGNAVASILIGQTMINSVAVSATTPTKPTISIQNTFSTLPYSSLLLVVSAYTSGTVYLDSRQSGGYN